MTKFSASDKKILVVAAAMLAVLLLSMAVAFSRFSGLESSNQWNLHSYQVLSKLQETTYSLEKFEDVAGRYLVDERFNRPYQEQRTKFLGSFRSLKQLTRDNAGQQDRLNLAHKRIDAWFAIFNPAVNIRKARGANDPRVQASVRTLRERMITLRSALNDVRTAELKLLQQRTQERKAMETGTRSATNASMLLACLFVAVLGGGLARGARQVQKTSTDLLHEIEQRKRAERESEILYRHNEQILNSTTEGIIGLNLKGRITFVNPAAAHMAGWDITELIGKSMHDFMHHTRADGTRYAKESSPVLASLQDGRVRRVTDEVFWRREGRSFPVEYTVTPLWEMADAAHGTSDDGENREVLTGAAVTFRDITERKRSEIALLRLASIVESSKDAILSHTLDGSIVSCNASAVRMYGYPAREMEGQSLEVLFPRDRADEMLFVKQAIAQGERIEPYQTTLLHKNGTPLDVAVTFYPVKDAAGNIVGASSNARPIRRQAGVAVNLPTFPFQANGNGNGQYNGAARETAVETSSA
jgi:PAS domain S-box-containing protein